MTQVEREQAIEVLQAKIDSIEDDQAYSQLSKSMYEDGYRRIDACKAAIAALREPAHEWIRTTDRLPMVEQVVVGLCGGKVDIYQMVNIDDFKRYVEYWCALPLRAVSALRGPQPDPDTGIMRCGCGRMNRLTFTKEFKKHEEIGHILCLKPEKLIEWEEKLSQYEDIGEPKELIKRPSLDENGLAQCGCGGKARIKHDGSYSSKCIVENAGGTVRYETSTVEYPGHTHAWVECDNKKCRCTVGYCGGLIFRTDDEARDAWNTAMSGGTYEQG